MFGNKKDTNAQQAAIARLWAMPVEQVAVELLTVMDAFLCATDLSGADRLGRYDEFVAQWRVYELMGTGRYNTGMRPPETRPALEALGLLDAAGLVVSSLFGTDSPECVWTITRRGQQALAAGDVAQRLARITG
jgi:hypothetical protein